MCRVHSARSFRGSDICPSPTCSSRRSQSTKRFFACWGTSRKIGPSQRSGTSKRTCPTGTWPRRDDDGSAIAWPRADPVCIARVGVGGTAALDHRGCGDICGRWQLRTSRAGGSVVCHADDGAGTDIVPWHGAVRLPRSVDRHAAGAVRDLSRHRTGWRGRIESRRSAPRACDASSRDREPYLCGDGHRHPAHERRDAGDDVGGVVVDGAAGRAVAGGAHGAQSQRTHDARRLVLRWRGSGGIRLGAPAWCGGRRCRRGRDCRISRRAPRVDLGTGTRARLLLTVPLLCGARHPCRHGAGIAQSGRARLHRVGYSGGRLLELSKARPLGDWRRSTIHAPMTPESIAHYRISSKLGEGAMGEVYRATDSKLGREVAIKLIPEDFARDTTRMARFTREAQVLASLNHPNIAAIYGVEDRALIMELVEGQTLSERIKQGAIPLEEALDIARQIADGLEAAHDKGIVHRDLKPANIKITPGGTVKLLDFGLAKAEGPWSATASVEDAPTLTVASTGAGVILGTAAYMAPEQARGRNVDKRADIWAFGVILYEMLTGEQMFEGETVTDVLASVVRTNP